MAGSWLRRKLPAEQKSDLGCVIRVVASMFGLQGLAQQNHGFGFSAWAADAGVRVKGLDEQSKGLELMV